MEKDLILMRMETNEKFKNPQLRKKFFTDEQTKVKTQIASVKKDYDDAVKAME